LLYFNFGSLRDRKLSVSFVRFSCARLTAVEHQIYTFNIILLTFTFLPAQALELMKPVCITHIFNLSTFSAVLLSENFKIVAASC
jgi:hypothetical protein